jgi:hypothetical protein
MMFLGPETVGAFIPIFALAIPIVAIVAGVASKISRTMARARIQELLIQERIKAIEKGITPPPIPAGLDTSLADDEESRQIGASPRLYHRNRVFGLRLGGAITLTVAAAIAFALYFGQHETAWVWMMIPAGVGACLIIASFFVPSGDFQGPHGPTGA